MGSSICSTSACAHDRIRFLVPASQPECVHACMRACVRACMHASSSLSRHSTSAHTSASTGRLEAPKPVLACARLCAHVCACRCMRVCVCVCVPFLIFDCVAQRKRTVSPRTISSDGCTIPFGNLPQSVSALRSTKPNHCVGRFFGSHPTPSSDSCTIPFSQKGVLATMKCW